jgi:hypothetical protein
MQIFFIAMCIHGGKKLDFEDEPPDDEGSASEKSEDDGEQEDEDDDSDADQFEDALEKLTLTELSPVVVAA